MSYRWKRLFLQAGSEATFILPSLFKGSGVYVIFGVEDIDMGPHGEFLCTKKLLYIGMGNSVIKRLLSHIKGIHKKDWRKYDGHFTVKGAEYNCLEVAVKIDKTKFGRLTTEARLIGRLQPVFNKRVG